MKQDVSRHSGSGQAVQREQHALRPAPGRVTLTSKLSGSQGASVQRREQAQGGARPAATARSSSLDALMDIAHRGLSAVQAQGGIDADPASVHRAAAEGTSDSGSRLPYQERIQAAFGAHDIGGVRAHVGGAAKAASERMGAEAYATGNHVAFRQAPDLHTAAHEAAHVVQQRAGVQLKGGVGQSGDPYEQHADRVADAVVRGESAEGLLGQMTGGAGGAALQRKQAPDAVQMRGAVVDPYGGGTTVSRDGNGKVNDNRGADRFEQGQMRDMNNPAQAEEGWREDVFLEMCAQLAYAPSLSSNRNAQNILHIHGYRTEWYATGNDPQTGLFVGVLGPREAGRPYIVCFRGTEPTTLADLAADIEPAGVGMGQFYPFGDRRVNPEIVRVLGSLPGGGNIVTGHSLGGALAQICATHYADRFGRVVTFQAPGISQAMVNQFNQREQRPRATHHIAAVDAVDRAGQEHLPGATYMHHTTQNDFTVPALDIPVYATPILQAIPGISGVNVQVQLQRVWNFVYGIMNGHMRRMLVSSQMSNKYQQVGMNGNWGYPHQIYGEGAMPTNQSNPIVRYDRYPEARENTSYEIDRRLTGIMGRVLARVGTEVVDALQAARQAFQWFIDETIRSIREGIDGGLDFWRGVFTF